MTTERIVTSLVTILGMVFFTILIILGLFLTRVVGQTALVYNPVGLVFDHDLAGGYDVTTAYRFGFIPDAGTSETTSPAFTVFTYEIPKTALTALPVPEGATVGSYRVDFTGLPALPVGTTWRAVLWAVDAQTTPSLPSNVTPEAFRFNACALEASVGVLPASVEVSAWPALKVGQGVTLTLTIRAPHPVQFVLLDLLGDDQPAWYFVTKVAPDPAVGQPAQVFWGPFKKAGTFEVFAQVIDSGGCQALLPAGQKVTVAP